ncbi:Glutamyl-tRNA(Gln) amidotransferase subunit E [uncultured archaeon]|nr:Glutamyl-tRNA(Gln) amidotransferase subunit E [uncultured archaeon]
MTDIKNSKEFLGTLNSDIKPSFGVIKSGIEIHQQLDTHKLFCDCPSILRNDEPKLSAKRRLHAVAGESGEVDLAAKHEASLDREFIYQFYDTNCLVELDEEPPHLINTEALKICLHIALHLNCEIVPIAQIMRKTVVDGSNTSGFQRTVIIARNGFVETKFGKVRIDSIGLEEDAARIVEKKEGVAVYRLDRLGIPLVEIGTAPDIRSPEQAKEVALFIGDVLRSCKVRRGIGTIRQDVNISISGHPRVEIKGFQDVKMFIPVIENEIKRQQENLKMDNLRSEVRNAREDGTTEFLRPMPGAARMYPETDLPLLRISREIINEAKQTLPKLRSDVRDEMRQSGLSEEMIKLMGEGEMFEEFKALLKIINDPNFIAKVLLLIPKEIASHEKIENIDKILTVDVIESIIRAVYEGKLEQNDVKHVMEKIAKGEKFEDAIKIEKFDLSEIEGEIAKIVKEKPGLSIGGYMGLVMAKFKGKVSGKDATDIINKIIKK